MIYRRGQLKNHYYLSYKYIQCYQSVPYKSSGIFDGIYHKRVLICQAHNKKNGPLPFYIIHVVNNDWGHTQGYFSEKIQKPKTF